VHLAGFHYKNMIRPTTSRSLSPGDGFPCTHWLGGRFGPRTGLHVAEKREISCSCRDSSPGSKYPATDHYTDLCFYLADAYTI